jgi:predicted transcriptional regulator
MTPTTKKLLGQVESWPPEDQEELAEYARAIVARRTGVYYATPEELQAIDEGIAELDRGEVASEAEVRAAFAKFRGR